MAVKKPVVNKKKTNIVAPKSNAELLGSIDTSLKSMNDFLQGEFFEKVESLDWKVWELHNRAEKNDKVIEILEDVKSLLRVHLMNDNSNPVSIEQVEDKPDSVIGKLFRSKK
jgi:hypothetical protein|tara:strand:- start:777 stop:1112 length:336 start_codon:yes stop_codon:yes gene_type:complete